ncbi:hypothetical protein [Prosthecobacter vanneervenii]|uniref:Transposase IS200-like domain-containing protein n=1 Tax=Prosthecobacter vanneervenii TaxID=48466 RepID=A0A7W7YE37_9BACT|nr:hypothetical protein [Prosthecobacter vanneervenii]MBB5034404.1 hypothetical protein [Prosthecobacter vanneervenii]
MGNHFHLLAEVPHRRNWLERFKGPDGENKLFQHFGILYSKTYLGLLRDELTELRQRGMGILAEQKLEALKKRFCDLSLFVKEIKERFSRWFNKCRSRRGTLWMDGFKSVLVEGKGEALGGSRSAQRGLCTALGKPVDGWKSAGAAEACRCLLHTDGREVKDAQNENVVRHGVSVESARAVLKERGKLSTAELVRLRVRYFTDGVALGSREFVEGLFEAQREFFGPRRKEGARRITEAVTPFYSLRRLRVSAVG